MAPRKTIDETYEEAARRLGRVTAAEAWDRKIPLDADVVLICREGFSSVFAAAQLREIGFERATDVIGGVDAWIHAGLPVLRQADEALVDLDQAVSG
jgi:rhodanese-related sulfurtransferase